MMRGRIPGDGDRRVVQSLAIRPLVGLVALSFTLAGCGSEPAAQPSPFNPSPVLAVPSGPPLVDVEVSSVHVWRLVSTGLLGPFGFAVMLRETTGAGIASVLSLTIDRLEGASTGSCTFTSFPRAIQQGSSEAFVLDICPFLTAADGQPESVMVTVRYSDGQGRQGSLRTAVAIERQTPDPPEIRIDLFAVPAIPTANGYYYYEPELILRETAGQTASIASLTFKAPNVIVDADCSWRPVTIAGHQSWNMSVLSYCAPYIYSQTPPTAITVTIVYSGLGGMPQTISKTVEVTP